MNDEELKQLILDELDRLNKKLERQLKFWNFLDKHSYAVGIIMAVLLSQVIYYILRFLIGLL